MPDFKMSQEQDGEIAILKLYGQATTAVASTFCLKLKEILAENKWMILDLSELSYICSASMGCLMASVNRARQNGGKLITTGVSDNVKRVFDVIKFSEITAITHSPAQSVDDAKNLILSIINET